MKKNNAYKKLFCCFIPFILTSCSIEKTKEKNDWLPLFNGKDLTHWTVKIQHHKTGVNFGNTFRAEEGLLKVRYDQYDDFNDQFGHLYYDTPFSNFHLKLEYRFSGEFHKGAPHYAELNSGVMFHSQNPKNMNVEQNWPISVEMQFLAELTPGKPRPTGSMCSPGTEIMFQGKPFEEHCLLSNGPTIKPNEWVTAELIVHGNQKVQHIINGQVVLEYSNPSVGGGVVNGFKATEKIDGKALSTGFIALQSEGHPIEFRNMMIRNID